MNKNLKDEITDILDKSGLVDIHLAHGLIIQPIIEHIKNNLPKEEDIKHEEDGQGCGCAYLEEQTLCETKDEGFKECLEKVKKGLGI